MKKKTSVTSIYRMLHRETKGLGFPFSVSERKNKYIFIHVPKVAGTSIARSLGRRQRGRKHLPWYVYKSANPQFFDEAFKFAFIRNPWDRVFSAYKYLCNGGNGESDLKLSKELERYRDFSEFLIDGLGEGYYRNHLLFIPQAEFVLGQDGEVVVDFLGRFENFYNDCDMLFEKLGRKNKVVEKCNESGFQGSYREMYKGNGDVDVVREIYKQDVRFLGYSF